MIQENEPLLQIRDSLLGHFNEEPLLTFTASYLDFRDSLRRIRREDLFTWLEGLEEDLAQLYGQKRSQGESVDRSVIGPLLSTVYLEYKEIQPQGDKDLGEYLRLRGQKALTDSKKVYGRIVEKYPDHELRVSLLRTYRTRQAMFPLFYIEGLQRLGKTLSERIQKTILYLLRCFQSMDTTTLSLLERIQQAQRVLPRDKTLAQEILDRLNTHSVNLNFHPQEFASISEVLSSYLGENLFSQKSIKLIIPQEAAESNLPSLKVTTFKPSAVRFSPEDLKAILINPHITGTENITLTYCFQYWTRLNDPDFENKVYLYSLNHKTLHNQIFQIIKKSVKNGVRDEIMLYEIFSLLSRGQPYEYSVRKDIYMQRVWNRIKPRPEKETILDRRAYAEAVVEKTRIDKEKRKKAADEKAQKQINQKRQGRTDAEERTKVQLANKAKGREMASQRADAFKKRLDKSRDGAILKAEELGKLSKPVLQDSAGSQWAQYQDEKSPSLSISQAVSALDDSEQQNLHLIFRRNIESFIQEFVENWIHKQALTVKPVNKTLAIISIKDFILKNYHSTSRGWAVSNERMEVKELGLNITDIEPIVSQCLQSLQNQEAVVGT